MNKFRPGSHTTLTETAKEVVSVLEKIPGVTLIAPGVIKQNSGNGSLRKMTASFTTAGFELLITGQGVQKIAVHCNQELAPLIFESLRRDKRLSKFESKTRERKPGI